MGRFDRQIATALRLIAKNGQAVTWRTVRAGDPPDPTKPQRPGPSVTYDKQVMMCFLPVSSSGLAAALHAYMGGTEVHGGQLYGLLGQVDFEPNIEDVVIRDGVQYDIDSIDTLSPNGQKVLYTVRFKA